MLSYLSSGCFLVVAGVFFNCCWFFFVILKNIVASLILNFVISVCFFNSLTNGEFSNLLIVAAFSNKSFSYKTSFPVKNSYLLTFVDEKAEILAVCVSKLFCALFCCTLLSVVLIFSGIVIL